MAFRVVLMGGSLSTLLRWDEMIFRLDGIDVSIDEGTYMALILFSLP